jgi:glutathione synthase
MRIAFLMDDIHSIKPYKDTSFRLALQAQQQGWEISYIESNHLFFKDQLYAHSQKITLTDRNTDYCTLSAVQTTPIKEFDVIFLRSDPPFDANYLYRTQLLDLVKKEVLIINNPTAVRSFNEKIFALHFPQYTAKTLISRDIHQLKDFLNEHKKIVVKPLDSMGGSGIFIIDHQDLNASVILETQTQFEQNLLMAQEYLPAITEGDKRILIIDGEPAPYALARLPAVGESRGNLSAGGTGRVQPLTDYEYQVAKEIGTFCRTQKLLLVGIDMIGNKVTEINVTSPTCMREIEKESGLNLAEQTLKAIQKLVCSNND